MTNDIQQFNFNDATIRVVMKDNEPWWVAKDVCDYFGDTNRNRTMQALDEDEKGYTQMTTPRGAQSMAIVSEAGLYQMLFAMQPEKGRGVTEEYIAERIQKIKTFKRWVTHEVLPSIRKHGLYATKATVEKMLNDPDTLITVLQELKKEREQNVALAAKIEEDKPKVLFADAVETSKTDILVGDFAKILKQNGIDTGQQRLFAKFRDGGWLIKQRGESWNMPTQKAMDMGLFRLKERTINNPDGTVRITRTAKITGKGQIFFLNKFLKEMKGE